MAQNTNHVVLVGNLTRDCGSKPNDYGYTQGGTARATISIACNSSRKDSSGQYVDEVSYFDVHIWGKTAENLKPYLTKGQKVAIDGKLKQERWQDKQTGNNMSRVVVNAMSVELLGGKKDEGQQSSYAKEYQQQYQSEQKEFAQQQTDDSMYGGEFPEDIPF